MTDLSELSMDDVNNFLKEQKKKLENDKNKQVRSSKYSFNGHEEEFISSNIESVLSLPVDIADKECCNKGMLKECSVGDTLHIGKNKEPFINLSVPKTKNSTSNTNILRRNQSPCQYNSIIDAREKEKDRLADLFASSSNPFINNLNREIFLKTKPYNSNDNHIHCDRAEGVRNCFANSEKHFQLSDTKDTSTEDCKKYNIPGILVSEYEERKFSNSVTKPNDNKMVRIGEFSPLNPNHPAGKPVLGIGEYEERRKFIFDQQKYEYNEYLKQISRSQTPTQDQYDNNRKCRDMATQTDWDEVLPTESWSLRHRVNMPTEEPVQCFRARLSPVHPCLEGLNEKEVKEQIYREELRKQIEEKNRLKEEIRKKEAEEEAKIEAKIQMDLEKIKRRLEIERLQRLEVAIRKKEQEDYLRQNLLDEQIKSFQDSKVKKKPTKSIKTSPPNSTPRQVPMRNKESTSLSQSLPTVTACKALSDVHEALKQPLLESQDQLELRPSIQSKDGPSSRSRGSLNTDRERLSPPIHLTKNVDMLVHEAALDPRVRSVFQQTDVNPSPIQSVAEQRKEVDKLLRQPLLPDPYLSPTSSPLLHATVAPVSSFQLPENQSKSPPINASNRVNANCEILEDKWKVPYVEHYNAIPPDVFTKHNRSVLTQLGAFRRHLQQERLRMQKRVIDESP